MIAAHKLLPNAVNKTAALLTRLGVIKFTQASLQ